MAEDTTAGDATATTATAGQTANDTTKSEDTITFSEKQQAIIQNLIDASYTKAFTKAESKYGEQVTKLEKQLEGLTKGDKDAQGDKTKSKFTADEVEAKIAEIKAAADKQIKDADSKYNTVLNRTLRSDIMDAAVSSDCISPRELADVLTAQGVVRLDDEGNHEINPPEGITKIGDDGKPITLNTFVERFIAKNPHWKKSNVGSGGTGSRDNGTPEGQKRLVDMTKEELASLSDEEFKKRDLAENLQKNTNWYATK